MSTASPQTTDVPLAGPDPVRPRRRRVDWSAVAWAVAAPVVTALAALIPLAFNHRFYFIDDTTTGALGLWYHLGQGLRSGSVQLFNPAVWTGGNYVAEAQWGFWNPFILLIGYLSTTVHDLLAFVVAIKVVTLAVCSLGTYLLTRSFGARPGWAFVAATAVPLGAFTVYFDAASWVTGLFTFALTPWAWWGIRRALVAGRNPLIGFVAAYLLITVGYNYAVLMLAVILLSLLPGLVRGPGARLRGRLIWCAVAVACALWVFTVFGAQVLTAGATVRSSDGIDQDFQLRGNLSGFATGLSPAGQPAFLGPWTGLLAPAPVMYLSWLLPAVCFVARRQARAAFARLREVVVFGVVATALVVGPSHIGPLRHPISYLPYVCLAAVVTAATLLSEAAAAPPSRRHLGLALGIEVAALYLAISYAPQHLRVQLLGGCTAAVGLTLAWALVRARPAGVRSALLCAVTGLISLGVHAEQLHAFPTSPLTDFGLPPAVSAYQGQIPDASGETLVVGQPGAFPDYRNHWNSTLIANSWYLNPHQVANVYTTIAFRGFVDDLKMGHLGDVSSAVLANLFTPDPGTALPIVDEMALNSLQVLKVPGLPDVRPPAGWHVASSDSYSAVWTRDSPVGPVGGVVHTSAGTSVSAVGMTDRTVRLRVDAVGPDGGTVLFSRLAWPGYRSSVGTLDAAANDWSLQLHLPATAAGQVVTVSFAPPGWRAEQAAWALGVALTALTALAAAVPLVLLLLSRRRSRRCRPAGSRI